MDIKGVLSASRSSAELAVLLAFPLDFFVCGFCICDIPNHEILSVAVLAGGKSWYYPYYYYGKSWPYYSSYHWPYYGKYPHYYWPYPGYGKSTTGGENLLQVCEYESKRELEGDKNGHLNLI
ncbi:hypothetical protein CEXT_186591 [Caerostris extrusa]|uniref:Uncharacterized protein n=1 Tax=Caerostris extrusa TaxID=172846 RepID=A0AAV4VE06_CAEEX|nr:hypothetical protein CEXT_186591 [Caerostris extrusa]